MKLISTVMLFVFAWSFIAMAQTPPSAAPAIVAAPAVAIPSGIMGWITAHGGFQAAVLLLVGSAFSMLSAVRQVLANFDGVAPGAAIPAGMAGLSLVNKICVILGQVVDFMTGNVQH